MWIKFKDFLIKFGVRGLVKKGHAKMALQICKDIIKEIEEQEAAK